MTILVWKSQYCAMLHDLVAFALCKCGSIGHKTMLDPKRTVKPLIHAEYSTTTNLTFQ